MDSNTRYRLISTGRGGELRALAQSMIADADRLPTKSELRAAIEEIYPGDEHAKFRADLAGRLTKVAEEAQNKRNRFTLRGIVDELVIKVETKLADDERLIAPREEEVVDMDAAMRATDKYSDRVGGELDRKRDQERAAAQELLRKAGR
jgi:hypothetical protein